MTPEQLAKSGSEHAHQRALFAWANMAERYGVVIANDDLSYTKQDYAANMWGQQPWKSPLDQPGLSQLHWLHAIKNQEKGGGDKRTNAIRGLANKAEGVKAGVADIFLPWPCMQLIKPSTEHVRMAHGLYIEMKKPKVGRAQDNQDKFRDYCLSVGYAHYYCYSWQEARDAILSYLGLTG